MSFFCLSKVKLCFLFFILPSPLVLFSSPTLSPTITLHNFTSWYGNSSDGSASNVISKDRLYFFQWGIDLNYRSIQIRRIISDTYYVTSLVESYNFINSTNCKTVNIRSLDEYINYIEIKYGTCKGNNCGLSSPNNQNKSTIRTLKFITNKNNEYSCGNEIIGEYQFSKFVAINLTEKYRKYATIIGLKSTVSSIVHSITFEIGIYNPNTYVRKYSLAYGGTGGSKKNAINFGRIYYIRYGIDKSYSAITIDKIIGDLGSKNSFSIFGAFDIEPQICKTVNLTDNNEYINYIKVTYGNCSNCGTDSYKHFVRALTFITNFNNIYSCIDNDTQINTFNYSYTNEWNATKLNHENAKLSGIRGFTGAVVDSLMFQFDWVDTTNPTLSPSIITSNPSFNPSKYPSDVPSIFSTSIPTKLPSLYPSTIPTMYPTLYPSLNPSLPTSNPSNEPSMFPSSPPTNYPSSLPSFSPSVYPSTYPSMNPSYNPSNKPSTIPSLNLTKIPSLNPSFHPTLLPSAYPTFYPSIFPTLTPSNYPSTIPSITPTLHPYKIPTFLPTKYPSIKPSINPTHKPTMYPSKIPTSKIPSLNPTITPSLTPTKSPNLHQTTSSDESDEKLTTNYPTRQPTQSPKEKTILIKTITNNTLYLSLAIIFSLLFICGGILGIFMLLNTKKMKSKLKTHENNIKHNMSIYSVSSNTSHKYSVDTNTTNKLDIDVISMVQINNNEKQKILDNKSVSFHLPPPKALDVRQISEPGSIISNIQNKHPLLLKELSKWDSLDVGIWISQIVGINELEQIFVSNEFDCLSLLDLDDNKLKELNINKMGHRMKILRQIEDLRILTQQEKEDSNSDKIDSIYDRNSQNSTTRNETLIEGETETNNGFNEYKD